MTRINRATCVLAVLAAATALATSPPSRAADEGTITDVVPADVGADDVFEVRGAGLALPGLKATLLVPVLNPDGSTADFDRKPLSVVSVADDRVALRMKSARAGEAFVVLTDGRGGRTIATSLPLHVHAAALTSAVPETAAAGGKIVVAGAWFGGRGTLRIGGARARVQEWKNDSITADVPRLPDGIHAVEIANKISRTLATGFVEVKSGLLGAPGRLTVRERGAARSYVINDLSNPEVTTSMDLYASVVGEADWHERSWKTCTFCIPLFGCTGCVHHHSEWTTRFVRDVLLSATGVTFDADRRAVLRRDAATTVRFVQGSHVRHSLSGKVGEAYRRPTTDLVVLLRRLPDGSLFGAFSGRRSGRLVEGSFLSAP